MNDQEVKVLDPVEALVEALAVRLVPVIRKMLMPEIEEMLSKIPVSIEADEIKGLDHWFENAIDEHDLSSGGKRVHADNIEDLDKAIEDLIKNATLNLDISF